MTLLGFDTTTDCDRAKALNATCSGSIEGVSPDPAAVLGLAT